MAVGLLHTPISVLLTTLSLLMSFPVIRGQNQAPAYFQTISRASSILSTIQQASLQDVLRHHINTDLSPLLASPALFQHKLMERIESLAAGSASGPGVSDVSEACSNQTAMTILALAERQSWALDMLDAMGKPGPDLKGGNLKWPGAYKECLSIPVEKASASRPNVTADHAPFELQYCNANWRIAGPTPALPMPIQIIVGVCVPRECSTKDLTTLLKMALADLGVKKPSVVVTCQPINRSLDGLAVAGIAVCCVFTALMLAGTGVDVVSRQVRKWQQEKAELSCVNSQDVDGETRPLLLGNRAAIGTPEHCFGVKVLLCFSVYTNGAKLLSTRQTAGTLSCVHGIRFLSMTWVVLGHVFLLPVNAANNLLGYFGEATQRWTFQAISNATVSVDTFFLLSGLLVSFLTLREMKQRAGRINWFLFYFHRFWRLTPPYMLIILIYVCLGPYWGEGPFWPDKQGDHDSCKTSWWTNLLYINNFVDLDKSCLGQSWYLANDMQFYILSPLILIPLYRSTLMGLASAMFLLVATTVTPAALTMKYHLPPGLLTQVDAQNTGANYQQVYYIKPYCRMGPYIIGMLTGYLLYHTDCRLRLNKRVVVVCWMVAAASALAVLYGLYGDRAGGGHAVSLPVSALYNAVHRTVWGACVAWVVVACVTGNGGFVNTLLSWQALVPLSRLTYCIYLLHIMMLAVYIYSRDTLFYYSDSNLVILFLALLVACYMVSAVVSLAFEAPMMALEKLVLPHRSR